MLVLSRSCLQTYNIKMPHNVKNDPLILITHEITVFITYRINNTAIIQVTLAYMQKWTFSIEILLFCLPTLKLKVDIRIQDLNPNFATKKRSILLCAKHNGAYRTTACLDKKWRLKRFIIAYGNTIVETITHYIGNVWGRKGLSLEHSSRHLWKTCGYLFAHKQNIINSLEGIHDINWRLTVNNRKKQQHMN